MNRMHTNLAWMLCDYARTSVVYRMRTMLRLPLGLGLGLGLGLELGLGLGMIYFLCFV